MNVGRPPADDPDLGTAQAIDVTLTAAPQSGRAGRSSVLRALATPGPLRRALIAYGQSALGDSAGTVGLLLVAYERLRSPWAITVILLADYAPRVVLGPGATALAQRIGRRACLVGADLTRAVALLALALTSSFALTVTLALLAGSASAIFRPLASAALPAVAGRERVAEAIAARATLATIGDTFGPILAAGLLAITTPAWVLVLDAGTFVFSAALLVGVPLGTATRTGDAPLPLGELVAAGRAAVRSVPGVERLLLGATGVLLFGGMIGVAEPPLARTLLHSGNSGYAALVACLGGGFVLGSHLSGTTGPGEMLRRSYRRGLALAAIGLLLTASAPVLVAAFAGSAITGIGNALALAREEQLIHSTVPDRLLELVLGIREASQGVALGTAFVAGGAIASWLGPRAVFAVAAAGVLLSVLVAPAGRRPPGA